MKKGERQKVSDRQKGGHTGGERYTEAERERRKAEREKTDKEIEREFKIW